MRFSHKQRFHKGDNFRPSFRVGRKYEFGGFICRIVPGSTSRQPVNRLGVIASRKVGQAVKRNRGKRIFREIFRTSQEHLPSNSDVIIIVRASFDQHSYQQLRAQFLQACRRYTSYTQQELP